MPSPQPLTFTRAAHGQRKLLPLCPRELDSKDSCSRAVKQDEGLAKVVKDNNLIGSFNRHTPSELIHGCMFGTVGKFNSKTIVRFHTAETSAGVWDAGNDRLGAGFVIADCGVPDFSKQTPVPTQVNLHLPGRVVVLKRIARV